MTGFSDIIVDVWQGQGDSPTNVNLVRLAVSGGMYLRYPDLAVVAHYMPRIKSDFILDIQAGVKFWNTESGTDFGYIDVAIEDQDEDLIDFFGKNFSARVTVRGIVNPSDNDGDVIADVTSEDMGFINENTIRLRLIGRHQNVFERPINEHFYDSSTPQLQGKPFPIAWGRGFVINGAGTTVPTVLVDPVNLLYHVTDLDINDSGSVQQAPRDRHQLLGLAQFNIVDNGFTLNQNPDGKISWNLVNSFDFADPNDGLELAGVTRFVRLALQRIGVFGFINTTELNTWNGLFPLTSFPTFFADGIVKAKDFMAQIKDGFAGIYYFDRAEQIRFTRLVAPEGQTPVGLFTDLNTIGEIRVEDDRAPGLSAFMSYGQNPGGLTESDVEGTTNVSLKRKLLQDIYVRKTTSAIHPYYQESESRDPILWSGRISTGSAPIAQAMTELNRWHNSLYNQRRRFYTFTVPMDQLESEIEIGDFVSLQSDEFKLLETTKMLFVSGLRFNFSQSLLTITGWG